VTATGATHGSTGCKTGGQKRIEALAFVLCAVICTLACVFFGFSYTGRCSKQARVLLKNRINPNVEPVASLVRLPGIGRARAETIVAYREEYVKAAGKKAFSNYYDLENVKGIGPKTAKNVRLLLQWD
jgi:DNA uptake protein ComE-like DNA-binding protein